jgi:hypothetical protein
MSTQRGVPKPKAGNAMANPHAKHSAATAGNRTIVNAERCGVPAPSYRSPWWAQTQRMIDAAFAVWEKKQGGRSSSGGFGQFRFGKS